MRFIIYERDASFGRFDPRYHLKSLVEFSCFEASGTCLECTEAEVVHFLNISAKWDHFFSLLAFVFGNLERREEEEEEIGGVRRGGDRGERGDI